MRKATPQSADDLSAGLLPCEAQRCKNMIVGSEILTNAYRWSAATYGEPRRALYGVNSAYNTGSLFAGVAYVRKVADES